MEQGELTFTERQNVVCLQLTPEQTKQLAPLAIEAGKRHENTVFVAVTVPYWSRQDGATLWELQVVRIKAKLGAKVKKLILTSTS